MTPRDDTVETLRNLLFLAIGLLAEAGRHALWEQLVEMKERMKQAGRSEATLGPIKEALRMVEAAGPIMTQAPPRERRDTGP